MKHFLRDLSLRYKIPLRVLMLASITAFLVTASILFRVYDETRNDLLRHAESMGRVLANTLVGPITHDDVWRAYEIINSPFQSGGQDQTQIAETILVLDTKGQIYASTRPAQYPMLADPGRIDPEYAAISEIATDRNDAKPAVIDLPNSSRLFVAIPVTSGGARLGTLVMGYSKSLFMPRFIGIAQRAALMTLLALAVLLPIAWYWGNRMAGPLVRLASCMDQIGPNVPEHLHCDLFESHDEIGRAGASFKRMLKELKDKERLEQEMMISERLAAVGRLSAGIAHEINNPLGGMLNTISTYKKHGSDDPRTLKTLSMLERGLTQIKDTVAALLVEAKVESHPLSRRDIEDTRTLVAAEAAGKGVELAWENDITTALPLPSTLVRQILINLLLNAIRAADKRVECLVYRDSRSFTLAVKNDGAHIEEDDMPYLFEPFSRLSRNGHGLGLWVTYQIARQLNGGIVVESDPGETRFAVTLPLQEES
ncbi:two-component sensor histidine kinase [Sulfurimicrobium lacus]|uniref:histidine kinase n=1 Tax=Sulfurimicrobium lacus TaxID=2715678 RepID=A0A6F8VDK1_9PROT|nr:HAMP domain-containing sensor histidine kinase [Sulfurimicrobium lacus]BCB27420.1 two-component sensor histidine kinase [Sulfurimicrobium lacus]